ncbi:MAG: hypothetical protein A2W00_01320 [Candidatus Eisenbacteria bacterium RBG_16_71_46]|nr:MAG: hypothetical protein A2W00_01320 [Candidatus Eisenbacteria bacterium RBG_16_71_46]OGF22436.1 MAG: hypothetical protein A2V63_07095 [Candidatus Eisenbacteria bacterium RBG_19FT_COMBO_70_11]
MRELLGKLVGPAAALAIAAIGASPVNASLTATNLPLNAAQQVPTNGSTATGTMNITVDTNANTLTYQITYGGLSSAETAAHIHGPAAPGTNAGVKHALPAGSPKNGVWNYPEPDEADILSGRMYVNIHTSTNPGGEIRGQIAPLVPGASSWGLMALAAAMLATGGFVVLRRRRSIA